MIKILSVRTLYSHWSQYSGINQFMRYLPDAEFEFSEILTQMGEDNFPIKNKTVRDLIRKSIGRRGAKAYELNDLATEGRAYVKTVASRPDIVQFLDAEHGAQFFPKIPRVFRRGKTKVLAMFHQPSEILRQIVTTSYLGRLDHLVLMSEEQLPFFLDHVSRDRISIIPHGIDTDFFRPSSTERTEDAPFRCVTVGKWLRDHDTIVALAKRLQGVVPLEFHVVASLDEGNLPANVFVHRNISDEELLALYQRSDALLLPLKDATANNALLEGLACGLPVVTSDLIATREYLGGADAIRVPDVDLERYAEVLSALSQDSDRCRTMGHSSRQRALELSWEKVAKTYEQLYRTIT